MSAAPAALPPLSAEELRHSERLVSRILEVIEAEQGWISFERYMEMALYEPGLGYYSAGARKLGAEGDFVTAPEISALFSRCLATQCAQVLEELGGGAILEVGAGSGVMAADVLGELERLQRLPSLYSILEVSADLRARQRETLGARVPHLLHRVQWVDTFPEALQGVVLANEVLDAFPVRRFRIRDQQVNELGVAWELGRLTESEVRASPELEEGVRKIEADIGAPLPHGYTSEISLRLAPWIASLAASLSAGVVLLVDYGLTRKQYYREERREGTLLCHYRHRFHDDPYVNVGLQDIGAWVDFSAAADAAHAAGMTIAGFSTQAHFLIGSGIETLLARAPSEDLPGHVQLARQAMILTLPGEMGERFKVLGLARNYDTPLNGFAVRDLTVTL